MQRFRVPALIALMVLAGIVGAAIYDWGKPIMVQVQERVTEAVVGKQPYDRFNDPQYHERRAREQEKREREEETRRLSERIDCLAQRPEFRPMFGC